MKLVWTVARFPDGSWSTGGSPDDPDYALCEVFRIEADSRDEAKKKSAEDQSESAQEGRWWGVSPFWNGVMKGYMKTMLLGLPTVLLIFLVLSHIST
ncbi:hypothetical protein P7I94_00185 (plasmid) [Pseudomonas aeruginosa]|uniref:hypothetical protein n=1 Tax=Pseudomonas aeruginosa TaxID=287 RepID=UPI00249B42A8|nr:hypothetical protein [Pseudomonas aeruginosa]WGX45679.1 hypothetical protein P7I94_00185 [Pseudomonas aeruginosa]